MSNKNKRVIWGLVLFVTLILTIYHILHPEISNSELREVTGTLNDEIIYNDEFRNRSIELDFVEDDYRYHASTYHSFNVADAKKDLHKGSVVKILVEKNSGISGTINKGMNLIKFHSLRCEDKFYLNLEDYNEFRRNYKWTYLIIWFIFLAYHIYNHWIKKEKPMLTPHKK